MRNCIISFLIFVYSCLFADGVQPIGFGTETDPYQVEILDNLLWISTNNNSWGSHFIQIADIDAADTENWNAGEGFSPIGNIDNNFTGSYDGQSFFITGLYINRSGSSNQGFFGRITNSTIENIILTEFYIAGDFNAAGLISHAYYSTVSNCYTQGSAFGTTHVSGLIGIVEGCVISYCVSYTDVYGEEFIGGMIGQFYQSTADNCSSFGYVEGIANLGGWAGIIFDSQINNCYSHSDVDAFMSAGGFSGTIMNDSTIEKCYSTGSVVGGVADIGGLIGMNIVSNVTNSFWDMESSGLADSNGGTGKTTLEMMNVATFTDLTTIGLNDPWDFVGNPYDDNANNDFWNIDDGYPFLVDLFTGIEDEEIPEIPQVVLRNYPNPFNPSTTIYFETTNTLESPQIEIYNLKGQKVKTIPINSSTNQPINSVTWNGSDQNEKAVSSGIYLYKLRSNDEILAVNRCALLK